MLPCNTLDMVVHPASIRLRCRPLHANHRLKAAFGYVPQKTSAEVFDHYLAARRRRSPP